MAALSIQSELEGEAEVKGKGGEYVSEEGEVAIFDYCIDNFFSDMDYICKLCSSSSQHDLDLADIDRFSSMITFLKEWKYFQYDPRTVSFPCESERVVTGISPGPVRQELKLPQFSSAAIPKAGKLAGEADSSTSDFVLCAGGSVWALDWCPRADDKPVSAITCEYLAVSAHPPGSYYHKMGASLKGRGAIQIWCFVTTSETVELSKPPYRVVKRRAKEALTVEDGVENDKQKSQALIKRRGRPKKVSLMDETNGCQVAKQKKIGRPRKRPTDEETCPKVPKKRGRPRKYAQSSNIEEEDKLLLPVSINLEGTGTTLALLPPPDAKSTQKGRKGRCKKGNFRSQEVCPVASGAKLNADMDKDLQCFEMAQKGHNDAVDNEANSLPIVEPLDVALPLAVLYEKKHNKRRLKEKQSIQKPVVVAAENNIVEYVTSSECQIVEPNLTETQCNAEAKLASSVCCPKEMLLPKLVFCLAHYGKVAWDIKWKPFATSSTARMGYLAALLGDGSLEVWEVPFPSTVQRLYSSNPDRGQGTDPRFLKLKAIFRCSKLTVGNRQSIPLTLEWSTSPPGDMILAGCHDGTVALWKFAIHTTCEDSRPLLVFTADSSPIRSLAWAPHDSENPEDANLFVVAGPEGLKFWDIRDPYHSLWEVNPAHKAVVSVDWLKDPRCILMTVEDGTMRIFSLPKGANDLPVTGMPLPRKQFEGLAAYCVTDGSVVVFQLTERFLEADPTRNRTPYFLCDHFKDGGGILELGPPFRNTIISNLPLKPIKGPSRYIMGNDKALVSATNPPPNRDEENNVDVGMLPEVDDSCDNGFPSKLVALHKVRWNKNKGTERWLCYGGAAGIIRFQKISFDS
ncbi:transducin/WD40 repeat-like superfamily protein isoform X2 [Carex rostrata]